MTKKLVDYETLSMYTTKIKSYFAEKEHSHKLEDIEGLNSPLTQIECSKDIISQINQLSAMIINLNNTVDNLQQNIEKLTPSIGEIYTTTSSECPSIKFGGKWEQIQTIHLNHNFSIEGMNYYDLVSDISSSYSTIYIWKRIS